MKQYAIRGARTTLTVVSKDDTLDDVDKLIIRGVIVIGDDELEFYVDNEKKYGCVYELKKRTKIDLDGDLSEGDGQ